MSELLFLGLNLNEAKPDPVSANPSARNSQIAALHWGHRRPQ
ncbi:hypothetical protein ACVWXL_009235 [Bradyrhizobium sp. GM22.5]